TSCTCLPVLGQQKNSNTSVTVEGLIIPRDNEGMYVRNPDGQFEIEWNDKTEVALEVNTRLFRNLKANVLRYRVQSSQQAIEFPIPRGPVTGIITVRSSNRVAGALQVAHDENWIAEHGLRLRFGEKLAEQLPTQADPRFIGLWDSTSKPRTLSIKGKTYEVSLKKGGQTSALLFNLLGTADCKPFINRVRVIGRKHGDIIVADQIHLHPIGDQAANDDPRSPRYLFIGDSISGNYNNGLRQALQGKFNIHHPPTNCGPSGKGKKSIIDWLGAYQQKERHWDVISFNFGHWDAGNDKATYQSNLEAVIKELEKTKAKLIWVTTCPVPRGMPPAIELQGDGRAPGRQSGVMEKYLNPWALEVVKRHPQISVCDQWQYCKDHENDLYKQWWSGKNVHFSGNTADALGQLLAEHVLKRTGSK
ncbi:MAG: SGNH/GDSL hydrolase family protein, partial [Pirellulaceae bacterium]